MKQKIDLNNLLEQNEEEPDMGDWHNHIKHLEEAHRVASLQINELERHPHVEEQKLAELKKLKLKYKDEIETLKAKHKGE